MDKPVPEEAIPFVLAGCLDLALIILTITYFRFRPNLNNAESAFLEELAGRELGILVVYPLMTLLVLGAVQLVPFPLVWVLAYLKYFTIVYYHGFIPLLKGRRDGGLEGGIRYGKICKAVLISYFILSLSLGLVCLGVFGLVTFGSGANPDTSGLPVAHYKVDNYGVIERVRMIPALGFEKLTSDTVLLVIHFWVRQQQNIVEFRGITYVCFFLSEVIDKFAEFVQNEYND